MCIRDRCGRCQAKSADNTGCLIEHFGNADAVPQLPEQMCIRDRGVYRGVDLFDCVMPSRNARHGHLFTWNGIINIKNLKYERDEQPLSLIHI